MTARTVAQQFDPGPANAIGAVILFFFAIGAVLFVMYVWGLLDAAARPHSAWRAADQNQVAWVLVQALLPIVGNIAYLFWIRPKVRRPARPLPKLTAQNGDDARCPRCSASVKAGWQFCLSCGDRLG